MRQAAHSRGDWVPARALCVALLSAVALGASTAVADTMSAPQVAVDVTAQLGADEVLLGEPFTLFITAVHERDVEVNLPTVLPLGSDLELVGRTSERRPAPDGRLVREFALELIAWELGERPIPAMPVTYAIAGTVHSAYSQALSIRVVSLLAPGQDEPQGALRGDGLRDILGPLAAEQRDRTLVYAGALAAAALLLGGVAVAVWRIRTRQKSQATTTRPSGQVTPASALKGQLQALEGQLERGEITHKQAFMALSAAMRGYLGGLYRIPARDWTTTELLAYAPAVLAHLSADRAALVSARLGAWLGRCDLVKYAGAAPSAEEVSAHLAEAYHLAEELRGELYRAEGEAAGHG